MSYPSTLPCLLFQLANRLFINYFSNGYKREKVGREEREGRGGERVTESEHGHALAASAHVQ